MKILDKILDETYGIFIFQEQLSKIVQEIGGFSPADAERVRKLVSKSKGVSELDKYKNQFIIGAQKNGVDEKEANDIWASIRESGAYLFNKSHAVAYSAISYQTAWLKTYYPQEFLTALMRHEEGEIRSRAVAELRDKGFEVQTPDINKSESLTTINEDGVTIFGLSDVDKVGEKAVAKIIENRPYKSFDEFMDKREPQKVNIRVVRNLIKAGAFDDFDRRDTLYYLVSPDESPEHWNNKDMWLNQMEVLDMPPLKPVIKFYDDPFDYIDTIDISEIDWTDVSDEIYVRGVISALQVKTGYGHMNINDGSGVVNVLLSEEQLNNYKDDIKNGNPVLVKAHMVKDKSRIYSDMIIPYEGYDKYPVELEYIKGERYNKAEDYRKFTDNPVGLVVSSNYFKSKRGNRGARIVFDDGSRYMCFDKDTTILAGDIIEYKCSKEPFINLVGVK